MPQRALRATRTDTLLPYTTVVRLMFQEELDVDGTLAQLLGAEGFGELEEVAYVPLEELAGIEGFDEELGEELQNRATEALERREAAACAEDRKCTRLTSSH